MAGSNEHSGFRIGRMSGPAQFTPNVLSGSKVSAPSSFLDVRNEVSGRFPRDSRVKQLDCYCSANYSEHPEAMDGLATLVGGER